MGRHTGTITKKLTGIDATASDTPAPTMPSLSPRTTTSTRWRRILPAALCAAALGAALTVPAIASAEPREWDIEAYDKCMHEADNSGIIDPDELVAAYAACCLKSGGALGKDNVCEASADLQTGPQINLPPGGLPTLTAVPPTPTPRPVAPTLTPAPITGG